jgi:ribosomal protein S12 methylthiotransferase accessory factor
VAADEWDASPYPRARQACAQAGLPWVPLRAELGTVVVGPLERPGTPGCVTCLHTRRRHAKLRPDDDDVRTRHAPVLAKTASSWLAGLGCDTAAAVVADTVAALAAGPVGGPAGPGLLDRAAVFVDLERLAATRHRFLPDPLCGDCGRPPDDTPERAELAPASRPKPSPHTYRVRSVVDELDELVDTYVDGETGLVRSLGVGAAGGLAIATADLTPWGPGRGDYGYGRTRSYRSSRLVALLEALERRGGAQPGGRRTAVCASYADLPGPAVDPRTLGTPPPESYRLPGFAYRPFTEDEVCRWVWGYSFARREPVLVPETVAYYARVPGPGGDEDRPFVQETSNGCALGGCLEEAILYGLLEVAERDAFLLTWYGRMPVPRIDLHSARDPAIGLQAAAVTAETGYEVAVYDTTVEHGIPCVWAMAVNPGDDPGQPKAACAGGAHPDPETAVLGALSEVGPQLADHIRLFPDWAESARRMAAEANLVTTLTDHALLNTVPEVFGRFEFLTAGTAVRSLPELRARTRGAFGTTADLRDDLDEAVRRYLDTGMDVIVVDQTTPEHRAGGLACAKVLIPGTVPMTFGHHNRRTDGLPRLHEVPHKLGYRTRPLTPDELNPHPHPFP